jgi:hypothetical protein
VVHVAKEQRGDALLVKLSGSIEETVDFAALIGNPTASKMGLLLKEILRINSVGVKAWIKYFQGIAAKGVKLRMLECSSAIVEQINLISNFTCGGTVESVYVPFCCGDCNTELLGLFRTSDLQKISFQLPELKCAKCGGPARFDDIPEEFFGFLMR